MGPDGAPSSVRAGGFDFARRPVGTSSADLQDPARPPVREPEAGARSRPRRLERIPRAIPLRSSISRRWIRRSSWISATRPRTTSSANRSIDRRGPSCGVPRPSSARQRPSGPQDQGLGSIDPRCLSPLVRHPGLLGRHTAANSTDFVADPSKGSRQHPRRGGRPDALRPGDRRTRGHGQRLRRVLPRAFPGYPGR